MKIWSWIRRRGESGQMLLVAVLFLPVVIGFVALTIDAGLIYEDRREAQNGADAAALAGGDIMLEGGSPGQAVSTAKQWASRNGYSSSDVTINLPPASGPWAGNPDYIEAIVEGQTEAVFSKVLGFSLFDINGRAVAGIQRARGPYAIIVLERDRCDAFEMDGTVNLVVHNAGTISNSNCVDCSLNANGTILLESTINDVVGGTCTTGPVTVEPSTTRVGHIEDPLAGLPPPTPPNAPVWPCPSFGGAAGVVTLLPGVYNCTINPPGGWSIVTTPGNYWFTGGFVSNGSGSHIFADGIYTIGGLGFRSTGSGPINGDGDVCTLLGVCGTMFYIQQGPLWMTGTGDVNLKAPTEGTYKDILFFQARNNTKTIVITGDALGATTGTVYAVNAAVDSSGNAKTTLQFVVDTFWAHGNSSLEIDYQGGTEPIVPRMKLFE